jgi:hypothetical protein
MDNKVDRQFVWDLEHVLEASCERADARLLRAAVVRGIKAKESVVEIIRLIAELDNERRQ